MKPRIGYIDALRGFTMLLVVFAHVELFCFGISFNDTFLGSLFITFRMPMFFFISGFIAYKCIIWDTNYYKTMVKKKTLVQIIPTLFFFYLYHCACHGRSLTIFFTEGPGAFWFTIVLFYMFMIYYAVMFITRNWNQHVSDIILIVISIVDALVYIGGMKYYDLQRYPILCLINLSRYLEFFVCGILCRKYQSYFLRFIGSEKVKALLLLSFLAIFIITWNKTIIRYSLIHIFNLEFSLRWIGLFLVFSIFYTYRNVFEKNNSITNSLRFIGRRTLDIYLIHYFVLPNFKAYKDTLMGGVTPQNSIVELFIVLAISILIIAACLLISAIIRSSSLLGHYLLGAKIEKQL